MNSLASDFEHAGLPLELRTIALSLDAWEQASDIVQMDIAAGPVKRRSARRTMITNRERYRIYPGHSTNVLEVLDVDAASNQLVLRVDEPVRSFDVRLSVGASSPDVDAPDDVARIETSGFARHFLLGMDEAHLFIAQLPRLATSVARARAVLRPAELDALEVRSPRPTIRQGEWFFVPQADEDERRVDTLARKSYRVHRKVGIAEAAGILRVGRPHVADEIVVIPEPSGARSTFVRGAVVHPDHRTIVLRAWHQVIPNTEHIEAPLPGIDWYD